MNRTYFQNEDHPGPASAGDVSIARNEWNRTNLNIKEETLSAISWNFFGKFSNQAVQFIVSIILARLLTPDDFGLIGMILVFLGFAELFSGLGFGWGLIQKKEIDEIHISSVFWLNLVSGLAVSLIMLALSTYIAELYGEPRLKTIVMVMSLTFLIGALGFVQRALLQRLMDFRSLLIISLAATTFSGVVTISLALHGFGFWSLAIDVLISGLITTGLAWVLSPWRPKFSFAARAIADLSHFSGNLLGFSFFSYWVRNADNFLVGRYFNAYALGIYSRAFNIMLLPLNQISSVISQVMFVSLSRIQDDKTYVKQIYLRSVAAIALVTFPMMTGLFVVVDSFILALLGPQWADVIPLLRIFCCIGLVQSVLSTTDLIFSSQGRTDLQFRWGIASGILLIGSFGIGILLGSIFALTWCYAFIVCVVLPYPAFFYSGKLIGMKFSEVLRCIRGIFICASVMAFGVYLFGLLLPSECPHWLLLILKTATGVILYYALLKTFKLRAYVDVHDVLHEQWRLRHKE